MSHIEGVETLLSRFAGLEKEIASGLDNALGEEVHKLQADAVALMPERTGTGKATLASPEAIKKDRSPDTGASRYTFGFITPAMRKAAYYLFWVEFGTKSYQAGQKRNAGKDKAGRLRQRKVDRFVPARRAQPFFRPAFTLFVRRMDQQRAWQKITDAAKAAVGFREGH